MAIVVAASLGGVAMSGFLDQANHRVVHSCQDMSGRANRHARGIFSEGNITAVVQAGMVVQTPAEFLEYYQSVK